VTAGTGRRVGELAASGINIAPSPSPESLPPVGGM